MTRGEGGWLLLPSAGLSPAILRQFAWRTPAGVGQPRAYRPPTQPRPALADHDDAVRPGTRGARSSCAPATLLTGGKLVPCGSRSALTHLTPSRPQPPAPATRGFHRRTDGNAHKTLAAVRNVRSGRVPRLRGRHRRRPAGLAPPGVAVRPARPACRPRQPGRLTVPIRQNRPATIDNLRKAHLATAVTSRRPGPFRSHFHWRKPIEHPVTEYKIICPMQ